MTDTSKAQILSNIKRAISVIAASPEEGLDLDRFKVESKCGTLHCAAGLLTTDPYFADLGMALRLGHGTVFRLYDSKNPEMEVHQFGFLDKIFGPDAFDVLFFEYGRGTLDLEIMNSFGQCFDLDICGFSDVEWGDDRPKSITDKQLALERLHYQLSLIEEAE